MPLTRPFIDTVKSRAERDPEFRTALLREAVDLLIAGDIATGKAILRDYVNATIGFTALAEAMGKNAKSLMRMLSAEGNPTADNIFALLARLQMNEGISLSVGQRPGNDRTSAGRKETASAA